VLAPGLNTEGGKVVNAVVAEALGLPVGTPSHDHDWRDAPPVLVASVEGPVAQGVTLDQAIEELLADSTTPVSSVQCPEPVDAVGDEQLCRAATGAGMVSIVASTSPGLLRLQVYGPA